MKIVLGVDHEHFWNAVDLLKRLKFEPATIDAVHVVEGFGAASLPSRSASRLPIHHVNQHLETQGRSKLDKAVESLRHFGYPVETAILHGHASKAILEYAGTQRADLIALGSPPKSSFVANMYGSVSKAVVTSAERSVLIAKNKRDKQDPVRAIFATDHSDYCQRCAEKLIEMNPVGIEEITVLTASRIDMDLLKSALPGIQHDFDDVEAAITEEIEEANEKIAQQFANAGLRAKSVFVRTEFHEAVETAMRDQKADLLIMGAKGKGFWDRIRLGSNTLHQALNTSNDLLVLRN
ncbi:MAG: universal stress protein [Fimbriimonadaceae bacterium]